MDVSFIISVHNRLKTIEELRLGAQVFPGNA